VGKRIVFEFLLSSDSHLDTWQRVSGFLESLGATHVQRPIGQPPHLLTAVLPDDADLEDVLCRLRSIPGVGRADEDAWRTIL
jgi:hypothetical protein